LLLNFTDHECHMPFDNYSSPNQVYHLFLVSIISQYSSTSWFVKQEISIIYYASANITSDNQVYAL